MSNKLEEMKKKLLLSRPPISTSDQMIENQSKISQTKEKIVPRNVQQQQILIEPPQQIKDKTADIVEQNNNSSSSSKEAKALDNQQFFTQDKLIQNKKESEPLENCVQQDLLSGEIKRVQQSQMKKNEDQACNLQLVDKNPFFSCSVDEEVKGSWGNLNIQNEKSNLPIPIDSKQQKKQQKIVLKELELVKQCIRNLKSSVKGLQRLQNMIAADPQIRNKVKFLLQQISSTINFSVRK